MLSSEMEGGSTTAGGAAGPQPAKTSLSATAKPFQSTATAALTNSNPTIKPKSRGPSKPKSKDGRKPSDLVPSSVGIETVMKSDAKRKSTKEKHSDVNAMPANEVSKKQSGRSRGKQLAQPAATSMDLGPSDLKTAMKESEASTAKETRRKASVSKKDGKKQRSGNPSQPAGPVRWWAKLKDVDPITLVPLSSLRVPPFELAVDNSEVVHRFDAKSLAVYLLSTGKFVNPINRQPMSREDCIRLDAHLTSIGSADQAKCAQMLELQNVVSVRPHLQVANEEAMLNLRREAGVIASHLFHYPSLRDRRADRRPSTNRGGGAVTVTDDDEHWESSFPQIVEDDFPDMPLVRRPAREDDFPPIGRVAAPGEAPRLPAPRPTPSPLSWATVAETATTRTFSNSVPQVATVGVTEQLQMTTLSWRQPAERPKLNLTRSSQAGTAFTSAPRSEGVFAKARPVDNAYLMEGSSSTGDSNLLCIYTPRVLRMGKGFGATWIGNIEKKFKELVDTGTSRKTLQLDPMPEPRRRLIQELAVRYWGLHVIEIDPEPYRFLQLSLTPSSFAPDMTLHRALITFPELASEEFSNLSNSSNGILFIGCPMSTNNSRVHDLLDALQLRESEYNILMLEGVRPDERTVFVDVSLSERARKTFKKLTSALPQSLLGFRCRKVEWWPCGVEWAKHQIRLINESRESIYAPIREQRRLEQKRAKNEQIAQMIHCGWDSVEDISSRDTETELLRHRLAATKWNENDETVSAGVEEEKNQKPDDSSEDDSDDDDDY